MMKLSSALAMVVLSQPPDLSGTWTLDTERSRVSTATVFVGISGAGAPGRLHITHSKNGTLVVESEINESHARIYTPGSSTSTPVFLGQAGSVTMTSRWEGASLVSEGKREQTADNAGAAPEIREVFSLGADGGTLEIEITTTRADGSDRSRLIYTRTRSLGPCESWSTPCKSR